MIPQLLAEHQDALQDRIVELGLQGFTSSIVNGAYSAYRLLGDEQADARELGTSRFGGDPDLPRLFDASGLNELVFVYQVNMADLPQAHVLGLPEGGLLSVFSDADADYGQTFLFENAELVRHRMPAPQPDYIFSNMKPWHLKVAKAVDFPAYGDDLLFEIDDAGLEAEYRQLLETKCEHDSRPCFGQILGRFSDLNGDMRKDAVANCGGELSEWLSLWKVFSSSESGLVISDFHLLHGMIRRQHLKMLDFGKMYSTSSNG